MTILVNTPEEGAGQSDRTFWEDEDFDIIGAIAQVAQAAQAATQKEVKRRNMRIIFKRGNIAGLGKHLAKKYGPQDEGFFTRCMGASELADYPEETRKAVCAKAHKVQIGKWPGEKPEGEKKECCRKIRIRRNRS